MERKKLIFDCDPGNDDAVALILAVLCGKYDILGITVAHGNKPLADTLDNALRLVEFLNADIPVYAGCPEAMVHTLMPGRVANTRAQTVSCMVDGEEITIHERHLKLPETSREAEREHACSFLVRTLREAREKVTIAATAPLTNLGMALRMAPEVADKIEQIVIMGGGVTGGNRTPAAEANFYDDPEAAQIVLHCHAPVRIYPLEATTSAMLSYDEADALAPLSREGSYVAESVHGLIRRCNLLGISPQGYTTVHDAVAVAGMIDPSIVTEVRRVACDVDCAGGCADGKLVADLRMGEEAEGNAEVVLRVDQQRYVALLREILSRAAK
jgi:inosine-uridine nucleoside N-ribohydrolase